jgi:hypothetical protein
MQTFEPLKNNLKKGSMLDYVKKSLYNIVINKEEDIYVYIFLQSTRILDNDSGIFYKFTKDHFSFIIYSRVISLEQ